MSTADRKLRVFLCHASQDKPIVRELYQRLLAEGWIDPWLDEEKLLPGQDWDLEIEKAVEVSDAIIICVSNRSVTKEGYVQKEIRKVLDIALEKPEDTIFIIPLRLDDCELPRRLRSWHYVSYFPAKQQNRAYQRLLGSLNFRFDQLRSNADGREEVHPTNLEKFGKVVTEKKPSRVNSQSNFTIPPQIVLVSLITGSLVGSGIAIITGAPKIVYINIFPLLLFFANAIEIISIRNTLPLITYRIQISFIVGSLTSLPVSICHIIFLGQLRNGIKFDTGTLQLNPDELLLTVIKFSLLVIIFWFLSVLGAIFAAELHRFMVKPK